jgi:signal peptidase
MLRTMVGPVRWAVTALWLAAVAVLLGLILVTHLATTFVIGGHSMQPAIGIGSLVLISSVSSDQVRAGDVVTVRADNGVVITHRVTRVVSLAGARFFELKGDANRTPDPVLVPQRALLGRVGTILPIIGYLAAVLAAPSGPLAITALLLGGLLAIWFLEELESGLEERRVKRGAAEPMGSPHGAAT